MSIRSTHGALTLVGTKYFFQSYPKRINLKIFLKRTNTKKRTSKHLEPKFFTAARAERCCLLWKFLAQRHDRPFERHVVIRLRIEALVFQRTMARFSCYEPVPTDLFRSR